MATKYAIAAQFSIEDRASATLARMSSAGKAFGGIWDKGVARAQDRLTAFQKTLSSAGKWAIGGAVGAASAGIVVATKQYANFDEAVRAAGAAYGPAFSQAAGFEGKLQEMGAAVRSVAAATEFDATQSANALKTLALAGVNSQQAVALLPGVADLATAAMTDMDSAVALAVGSLNTMGMMSDKPEQLAANMTRISDVMAHTANSAYMSLQDVAAAISQGGSFFKTSNNDLNVMSGSLTALAANSIKGAEAGTDLRNIMTNLSAPTAAAATALQSMGIKTTDTAGNLLSLPKIIGQMNKAMAGMGDAERNANLYQIFGKQNIAAVTALLNTGQDALEKYAIAAANSAGTVTANAEAMRGSLINKFKVLQSALTELGFKFVDAFAKKGGDAIAAITKAVSEFDPAPIVNALVGVGNVIAGVAKVAWKLRGVIAVVAGAMLVWRTATTVAAIALAAQNMYLTISTGAHLAYGIVVKKSAAATSAFSFATVAAKKAAILFADGLKILTAAQGILNAVMAANPVGAIITAVVVLTGLVIMLANKWQTVTGAVEGFFAKMRNMEGVGGAILKFVVAPFELLWNQFRGIFDIINAFKNGGFLAGIKMLGVAFLQSLAAPLEMVLQMLSAIPGIGDTFASFNDTIHNKLESMRADILFDKKAYLGQDALNARSSLTNVPADYGRGGADAELSMMPPSMSAAAAESYSREEKVTTNRLDIGLARGLEVRNASVSAPEFTLFAGR